MDIGEINAKLTNLLDEAKSKQTEAEKRVEAAESLKSVEGIVAVASARYDVAFQQGVQMGLLQAQTEILSTACKGVQA